jgi:hypothetical protein
VLLLLGTGNIFEGTEWNLCDKRGRHHRHELPVKRVRNEQLLGQHPVIDDRMTAKISNKSSSASNHSSLKNNTEGNVANETGLRSKNLQRQPQSLKPTRVLSAWAEPIVVFDRESNRSEIVTHRICAFHAISRSWPSRVASSILLPLIQRTVVLVLDAMEHVLSKFRQSHLKQPLHTGDLTTLNTNSHAFSSLEAFE